MATMDVDSGDESSEASEGLLQDASSPEVVEKYKVAGEIANRALCEVLKAAIPGKLVVELCELGDRLIKEQVAQVYPGIKSRGGKGVAFPTCVSVNEVAGHFSPFREPSQAGMELRTLQFGDVVKVDLGVHIDGFPAVVAHTVVLGATTGRKADVVAAAWTAAQAVNRLLKAHESTLKITKTIEASAAQFECHPVESVMSHEMRQHVIDHENTIRGVDDPDNRDEWELEHHTVFGIDIMMSTGRGKAVERGDKCTVYKRNVEVNFPLKMKTSRELLKQVNKQFPTFPFTLREFEGNRARLGVTECRRANLLQPYPVLAEKAGEFVAQFKYTAIIRPTGTMLVTGLPLVMANVMTDKQLEDEDLKRILGRSFEGDMPSFFVNPAPDADLVQGEQAFLQEQRQRQQAKAQRRASQQRQQGRGGKGGKSKGKGGRQGGKGGKGGKGRGGGGKGQGGQQKRRRTQQQKGRGGGSGGGGGGAPRRMDVD